MHNRIGLAAMFAATVALGVFSAPIAQAAVTVFGDGHAQMCALAAQRVEKGLAPDPAAFQACDQALTSENLTSRDFAGTYVNRGILYIARAAYSDAKQDFDSAISIMPDLGEAYTDRGAVLLALRRYSEAIAEINHGLALNSGEPEKAYFNRALAEEALDDIKAAYLDYSHAAELKPDWNLPRNELLRFTVGAPPS